VPHHDPQRIGARIAVNLKPDYWLAIGQVGLRAGRDEPRVVDRRNLVPQDDRRDFAWINSELLELGLPSLWSLSQRSPTTRTW
jgi:hypothetical protein